MAKKKERILGEIRVEIILTGALSFGVVHIAPIFGKHLSKAQELQRMGTPSSEQNALTLFWLACLSVLVFSLGWCIRKIIFRIYWRISWNLNRKRRISQDRFEVDCNTRALRKVLFEEIKNGIPIPEEEELWKILSEMSEEQLNDAIEERRIMVEENKQQSI